MSDLNCPRDQGPSVVPKVPRVGEVGLNQIAAGIVEVKVKDERLISQESLLPSIQGLQLGHTHGEGDLVWGWSQKNQEPGPSPTSSTATFSTHKLTSQVVICLSFLCLGLSASPF